jgi:sugar (pentulose or hexulose) kinase
VRVCGEAVADPLFCQMIADATQLPVLAGPGEATLIAAGVAVIGYEPNSTTRDRWDEHYGDFLDAAATSTYGIGPS